MSPDIKGNLPTLTKRKKNRDKKPIPTPPTLSTNDFNMTNCTYFPTNLNSYTNLTAPDSSAYYSFLNYTTPAETMSLPVYPYAYPNFPYPATPPNLNYMGALNPPTKPPTMNHQTLNIETNEYMSLPVGSLDQNDNTTKRRFSDPGLPNDSDSSVNSLEGRLIQKLTQQVNALKESNRKLNRDMLEMRIELNMLKQQQIGRHYERDYEPGMLADVIREVRDAARVREDALLARVKHLIEEKHFSMNQLQLVAEKNRNNERLSKLEEQLKNLSVNSRAEELTASPPSMIEDGSTNNQARQVIELEREALILRRELQDARAKKEESDKKFFQLDKKLNSILRQSDVSISDISEDGKTTSADSLSVTTTTSSVVSHGPQRVTLSGPVTDL